MSIRMRTMRNLRFTAWTNRWRDHVTLAFVGCNILVLILWVTSANGKDLMPQKEQETTEIGSTQIPSFDYQKTGIPQSLFTWIKLAKGFEVEWDTFGRKGWYTQDPRL